MREDVETAHQEGAWYLQWEDERRGPFAQQPEKIKTDKISVLTSWSNSSPTQMSMAYHDTWQVPGGHFWVERVYVRNSAGKDEFLECRFIDPVGQSSGSLG